MLNYKEKPLEELNLQETYEFEKEMLERLSQAARGQMSNQIIGQINTYIALIRDHKLEILERERLGIDHPDYEKKQRALNIGDEPQQSGDTE